MANAFKLIELPGAAPDPEAVKKTNSNFAGDQSPLRALGEIYKARGVAYNGGLEEQNYDPESAFQRLGEYSYNAFIRQGALNSLASAVSKIAALEGIDFPSMVDEAGADDAMRAAAGLSDV